MSSTPRDAPDTGVVEVNLFGPGYGESVLVHLGDQTWLIADSCATHDRASAAALQYLLGIGVDASLSVRYILATHWHDDHIRGLSEIVEVCRNAEVFISQVLTYRRLTRLLFADEPRNVVNLREMTRVMQTLEGRDPVRGSLYRFLDEATAIDYAPHHNLHKVAIWALSPSASDVRLAIRSLRPYLDPEPLNELPTSIARPNENHASVVLHLTVGAQTVLLGADREVQTNEGRGWNSVLTAARGRGLPAASLYKVSHHGSPNGDTDAIWEELLGKDPVAFLSPYRRGLQGGRPRESDVDRICGRTRDAFTTSLPMPSSVDSPGFTESVPQEADSQLFDEVEVEPAQLPLGHLRARSRSDGGPWQVEMFEPAGHLCRSDCRSCTV